MPTTNQRPTPSPDLIGADLTRTARATGRLYLGLAITGLFGSVLVRRQLYVPDDPQGTLSNLVEHATLARGSASCSSWGSW